MTQEGTSSKAISKVIKNVVLEHQNEPSEVVDVSIGSIKKGVADWLSSSRTFLFVGTF